MQITYQKKDGTVFQKYRNTPLPYKIGSETSMGWKVLNIEYGYKDKYYTEREYDAMLNKIKQKILKKRQAKETFLKEAKTFLYYFIAVLIISFLKLLLGI